MDVAERDDGILAVGLTGSRANPEAKKDRYQDFDVVYIVRDMQAYIEDTNWLDAFGQRVIMQTPEDPQRELFVPSLAGRYTFLMQFSDGNRIDLMLCPANEAVNWHLGDAFRRVLMDKNGLLPVDEPPGTAQYHVKRPTQMSFSECCNEFWWVSLYVAKGLCRKEYLYACDHMEILRSMTRLMLSWLVGAEHDFSVSLGKHDKDLEQRLAPELWEELVACYDVGRGEYVTFWQALHRLCRLFGRVARQVAGATGVCYDEGEEQRTLDYLKDMKSSS